MRAKEFVVEESQQPKVYLDMDGVLADFVAGYNRVAGTSYAQDEELPQSKIDPVFVKITGTNFFETLPKYPSADALVKMIVQKFGHYNICSSPLRNDHENSKQHKTAWLQKHLNPQPREIVITPQKYKHARQPDGTPNILIDDKMKNIAPWRQAGGIGILYNAGVDDLSTVANGLK